MSRYKLHHGDCLEVMRGMADNSVDAVVTDPPYGLKFMGKEWDHGVPGVPFWVEALRVLKPGGHLLAFGGSRTYHRLAVAVEDAGFEVRDQILWLYGTGFPKSRDISKAIDKEAVVDAPITAPSTQSAKDWQGWGTALKPAHEPIVMARKPFNGTVAANVLRWGTGAINVAGCRVEGVKPQVTQGINSNATSFNVTKERRISGDPNEGRWPANLIHDGSEEVVDLFPVTGASKAAARGGTNPNPMDWGNSRTDGSIVKGHDDNGGSAARFFYVAKASKKDRNEGLPEGVSNNHPTVKPTALMRYLCRMVARPGGVILDPFMGSGSTGKAAMLEGFQFIGIELDADYLAIAEARIQHAAQTFPTEVVIP